MVIVGTSPAKRSTSPRKFATAWSCCVTTSDNADGPCVCEALGGARRAASSLLRNRSTRLEAGSGSAPEPDAPPVPARPMASSGRTADAASSGGMGGIVTFIAMLLALGAQMTMLHQFLKLAAVDLHLGGRRRGCTLLAHQRHHELDGIGVFIAARNLVGVDAPR